MLTRQSTKPELLWLRPSQLMIEPVAQREFRPKWAKALAETWDPDKLGEFVVSERDGKWYVVDGQHRRAALLIKELDDPVPCIVRRDQTVIDDAKRFVAKNNETLRVHPIDAYRKRVVAQEPAAMDIDRVVTEHGLTVNYNFSSTGIAAIGALEWVYNRGGAELLDETLTRIEKTWGQGDRTGRDGHIIKAYALVAIKLRDQVDWTSMCEKVQRDSTAGRLLGTARASRMVTGKALYAQVAEVMVTIYNKGRSVRRVSL